MEPSVQRSVLHFDKTFSKWEPVTDYVELSFLRKKGLDLICLLQSRQQVLECFCKPAVC